MSRRIPLITLLGLMLALSVACTNKESHQSAGKRRIKQPDKVLFDRAMDQRSTTASTRPA
jgi:hypothetical protein